MLIKFIKRVFAALWLLSAVWPAFAYSLADIQSKGQIKVAVYKAFPPFSDNGKGIDVDLAAALAEKLGVKPSMMWIEADESVEDDLRNAVWKGHYLGGGTADVMMHVPTDPEFMKRNDEVKIFSPYYTEQIEVLRSVKSIPTLPNLEVFAREKIGVELETVSDIYLLSAFSGRLRSNVVHFRSPAIAVKALRDGEVAAVMAPRSELDASLGPAKDGYKVSQVPMPDLAIQGWKLGLAVKDDNTELAAVLEKAMRQMLADGTIERIFKKHGIGYRAP